MGKRSNDRPQAWLTFDNNTMYIWFESAPEAYEFADDLNYMAGGMGHVFRVEEIPGEEAA